MKLGEYNYYFSLRELNNLTTWEEIPLFELEPLESPTVDNVEFVFDYWVKNVRTKARVKPVLSDERRRKIKKALDSHGLDVCLMAIDGVLKSEFHMGQNSRGKQYNDISLILRDAQHIEKFAEMADEQTAEEAFLNDEE